MARIKIILKDGRTGSIDDSEFDPTIMSKVEAPVVDATAQQNQVATQSATPQTTQTPSQEPEKPKQTGLVGGINDTFILGGLLSGLTKYGQFTGAAGEQAIKAPGVQNDINAIEKNNADMRKTGAIQEQARKLVELRKTNPNASIEDLQNPEIMKALERNKNYSENASAFYTNDEIKDKLGSPADIALTGSKAVAGASSYLIPGGGGLLPAVGKGITSGVLAGFGNSEKGNEISDSLIGGATSGVMGGGSNLLTSSIKKISGNSANRIMDSVFKETIKDTRAAIKKGDTLGQEALKRGIRGKSTESIFNKSVQQINDTEDLLQEALIGSKSKVAISQIREAVKPLIQQYKQSGNTGAADAIESRIAAIANENGDNIPVALANQIKRSLYDEARKSYGTEASAGMEGIKAVAKSIKSQIAKNVDGVDQLNKDLSFYGRTADSMGDKLARGGRNNVFGLGNKVLAGAGLAGAVPTGGLSMLPVALTELLGTTMGKTNSAAVLNKISKGLPAKNITGRMPQILSNQVFNNLPVSSNNNQSTSPQNGQENKLNHTDIITSGVNTMGQNTAKQEITAPVNEGSPFEKERGLAAGTGIDALLTAKQRALSAGDKKAVTALEDMLSDEYKYLEFNSKNKETNKAKDLLGDAQINVQKIKELYGVGTPNSLSQGKSTVGAGGVIGRINREKQKATDQGYMDKLTAYNNTRAFSVGLINQARGAGVLNADEYIVMKENMPNEYSSEAQAKAWFDNLDDLLKRMSGAGIDLTTAEDTQQQAKQF